MGDETWASIQLVKSTRESFREKMKKRKAERETILNAATSRDSSSTSSLPTPAFMGSPSSETGITTGIKAEVLAEDSSSSLASDSGTSPSEDHREIEFALLDQLNEALSPVQSSELCVLLSQKLKKTISSSVVVNLLQKFAYKELISIKQDGKDGDSINVISVEHAKVTAAIQDNKRHQDKDGLLYPGADSESADATSTDGEPQEPPTKVICTDDKDKKLRSDDDVMRLLSAQSIRERENKKVGEEIMELLSKPTAKEQSLAQRFRSQGGAKVQEFCPHGTKEECEKQQNNKTHKCGKLHFRKIIQKHTDESLGDCSFLNTCFHMDSCRYVHYEVDYSGLFDQQDSQMQMKQESPIRIIKNEKQIKQEGSQVQGSGTPSSNTSQDLQTCVAAGGDAGGVAPPILGRPRMDDRTILFPSQWIQCDLRFLDMAILGKFAVIMADPPWDIHMELPYGTMSDDEMRQLSVPTVQDEGLIFLWVTGRAMELGRECLLLWGYERVDEIIWVKTNQLQRIIRTGRTGHWLNHGKEHCLVGMKGNPRVNKWLDCDVIVAEVRATSHKPDEIYGIIERLSPGTRKLELFGRPHNVQPNWLTLGNQLEGINLLEEDLVKAFKEHYPDGICRKAE